MSEHYNILIYGCVVLSVEGGVVIELECSYLFWEEIAEEKNFEAVSFEFHKKFWEEILDTSAYVDIIFTEDSIFII